MTDLSNIIFPGVIIALIILCVILFVKYKKAEKESVTDPLTGLPNRRYFAQRIKEAIAHAKRYGKPLFLLIIDIDNFKIINDEHSYEEGDKVLIMIAEILKNNLRESDILARYGGDEFFAAVLEGENGNTKINAQRIVDLVQNLKYKNIELSISMGIGMFMPNDDFKSIYKKTNEALKIAKKTGKGKLITV